MSTPTTGRTVIGRPFTDAGIQFEIVQRVHSAIYPYRHTVVEFNLEPTARGRRSDAYLEERRQLGDDWVRSIDPLLMAEVFTKAGVAEDEALAILGEAHQMRTGGCS